MTDQPNATDQAQRIKYRTQNLWWLAFAVLGTEIAWAFHLEASYVLAPSLCDAQLQWLLHLLTLVALLIAGSAFGLAAHDWWKLRGEDEAKMGVREGRDRFLLSTGVFLGALMIFAIIGNELAIIFAGCG